MRRVPPSFTAETNEDSFVWRQQFVQTLLERDLPVSVQIPAPALLRFWSMLAHYHGQIWNAAELARSLGVNETTTRRYLDLLESLFMVRVRLTPSIRHALDDLGLERIWVVYPGERPYRIAERVEALPAAFLANPTFT